MPPKRIKRRSISRLQSSSGSTKGRWWDLITKKSAKKWSAQFHSNRKKKHLGLFDNKEEAHTAFYNAYLDYHGVAPWN